MNGTLPSDDDRAASDAIDWVIWLAEEPDDPHLRARFDDWLMDKPANQAAWQHANRVSDLVGQSQSVAFLSKKAGGPAPLHAHAPPHTRKRRWPVVAAVAMAACLALLLAPGLLLHLKSDYRTGTAQQRLVTLRDGSTVQLGPQSAIAVSFTGSERQVRLLAGEAYFEVKRDTRHPFRVFAADAVTTVLGTGFNVRLDGDSTDVAVSHGRVRVDFTESPGSTQELVAGQWAAMRHGRIVAGDGPASLVGAWSSGKLAVVDQPVEDVIADIRRYYHGLVIVRDGALDGRSASGNFDMADPASAIVALVQPHGATVRRITPWLLIVSRD